MFNTLLFLGSCILMSAFAWFFLYQGKSALTTLVALLSLMANLFVLKQITLLGLNATASDIFAIGGLLSLNLLQEKFGFAASQKAIWISFSGLLFFVVMSQIHLNYESSPYDLTQAAYVQLLTPAPRLMLASLFTFWLVQQFDSRIYRWVRASLPQLSPLWVSGMVMCFSQFLDTLLFSFLGLYGLVSALAEIMIISYGIKLLAIAITIPGSFLTRRLFARLTHVS